MSIRRFTLAAAAAAMFVLGASIAQAVPVIITTADGQGADAYVEFGNANTNFGNSGGITIKNSTGGASSTDRKGYVRFDLSSLPSGAIINSAALHLSVATSNSGGSSPVTPNPNTFLVNLLGLNDGAAGQNWIETGPGSITWNNAPANNTTSGQGFTSDAEFLAAFAVTSATGIGDTIVVDDASLLDFLLEDTDGIVTFMLRRVDGIGSWNLAFASKEHPTLAPPSLLLDITIPPPIPEPSTIAIWSLLGAAAAGFAVWRRRK